MDTILESKTKIVFIGPGRPLTIIGERINPTGRKLLAAEMEAGNYDRVRSDAVSQVEAGAHMLDVNAGIPTADEPAILAEAIKIVQSVVDVPISIDSSVVAALEAGLEAAEGKPLVNSVTGEDERLESVLPLVKKYGAAVIGISNDETGISHHADVRFAVAKKIVERAMDYGIPKADVLIDPLVMPAGAVQGAGQVTMQVTRQVREELGVNTVCGASNVSFGLPGRGVLNGTFLAMMIANGLTAAITNPIESDIKQAILAADLFMGHDENCAAWIAATRGLETGHEDTNRAERRQRRSALRARRGG
ncbi:MAG: dihydropteroate synthase [Anaerolineales bacterium]|nr:MAG: dihydropteroate synthase [Anaerolineales bacterium]